MAGEGFKKRFAGIILTQAPEGPGVVLFHDHSRRPLFITASENVRRRLLGYLHRLKEPCRPKQLQFFDSVASLEYVRTESINEAHVVATGLIEKFSPIYNRTRPAEAVYFYFRRQPGYLNFQLLEEHPEKISREIFGAFKGGPHLQKSFLALTRLTWRWVYSQSSYKDLPQPLLKKTGLSRFHLLLPPLYSNSKGLFVEELIQSYLSGAHSLLLAELKKLNETHPFFQQWLDEDLECLARFFVSGPLASSRLKQFFLPGQELLHSEWFDELLSF